MKAAAPMQNVHLIVQHDKPDEAKRYLIKAGSEQVERFENVRRDVNTGSPEALAEFLEWALRIQDATADHHVLIFSGLGINPRYVRQSLPLEALPKTLREFRGGKPEDPNNEEVSRRFTRGFKKLTAKERESYREAIHNRAFTICHDFSNSGSLQVSDLREVLAIPPSGSPKAKATHVLISYSFTPEPLPLSKCSLNWKAWPRSSWAPRIACPMKDCRSARFFPSGIKL